ncbi:MAG: oligosaccharide flippase family protein [Bacillota bacterium]
MNKFFKAFMAVTTISVATRTLCFFFKIYLSRTLSLEMLGSYQIAMNIFMVFVAVVSSGLPITLSREVAFESSRGELLSASKKTTAGLFVAVILSIVSCFGLLALSLFLGDDKGDFLSVACFSLLFFGVYSVTRGYLWGRKEFFAFSFLEFIEEVLTFVFAYLFLKFALFDSPLQNVALSFVVASVACGCLGIYAYFSKGGSIVFAKNQIAKIAKSSAFITVMRICGTAFASLYTICLPLFLVASGFSETESLEVVGLFYGMVAPLLFIPSALVSGLSLVLVPEVASLDPKSPTTRKTIRFAIRFAVLFAIIFIPFYYFFGVEITSFVFKNSESGSILKIACVAVLPISLNLLVSGFMNSLALEKSNFIHFLISGLFCFSMLYPATVLFGEYGIVIIFTIQPTIPCVLNIRTLAKKVGMKAGEVASSVAPAIMLPPCMLIAILLAGATASLPTFVSLAVSGLSIFAFCSALFYVFFYTEKVQ